MLTMARKETVPGRDSKEIREKKFMTQGIDFVITYVDGNDIEWQKQKNEYTPGASSDVNPNRYREWENLQYLFRGIERFAPWVRTVHFVTWGHVPSWLNVDHPKLHIVNHRDYIPEKWLPTFNNRCIELNLHRIPGLSEEFVYFNDDMFLVGETKPEDFFKEGLPCDTAILFAPNYKMTEGLAIHLAPTINTAIVNKHFNIKKVIRKNPGKWFTPKYGMYNFLSLPLLAYHNFTGFFPFHLPYSYLKSTFAEIWEKEPEICTSSSEHSFREIADISQWLMNYWQFASGNFVPRSVKAGKCFQLHTIDNAKAAAKAIRRKKYKMVCLNDDIENPGDFKIMQRYVNKALESILPEKSSYEL